MQDFNMKNFNLEGVDEKATGGFEPIPAGIYNVVIEKTELKFTSEQSKTPGAPMISWTYNVLDGEFAGRKLFNNTVLHLSFGQAMLKKTIMCAGLEVDMKNFDIEAFIENGDAITGVMAVKVNVKPFNGKQQNNVVDILPVVNQEDDFGGDWS